jgi:hypothetical protein
MTDLRAFLDEVGEEVFGLQWVFIKPHVARWLDTNPERLAWLESRLRTYAEVQA